MTQQEFENRVEMTVSASEFIAINEVYMNSDLDKDAFCKMWVKINRNRVKAAKEQAEIDAMNQERKYKAAALCRKLEYLASSIRVAANAMTASEQKFVENIGLSMTLAGMPILTYELAYDLGHYAGMYR